MAASLCALMAARVNPFAHLFLDQRFQELLYVYDIEANTSYESATDVYILDFSCIIFPPKRQITGIGGRNFAFTEAATKKFLGLLDRLGKNFDAARNFFKSGTPYYDEDEEDTIMSEMLHIFN